MSGWLVRLPTPSEVRIWLAKDSRRLNPGQTVRAPVVRTCSACGAAIACGSAYFEGGDITSAEDVPSWMDASGLAPPLFITLRLCNRCQAETEGR